MKKVIALAFAFSISAFVSVQAEDFYTDAQASEMAKALIKDAYAIRKEVASVCSKSGMKELSKVAEVANTKLREWPNDNLKYRALFPYSACRQSMTDVLSYAAVCATGGYKGEAASYDQRRWKEDTAECEASIQNPDLSLKEIE